MGKRFIKFLVAALAFFVFFQASAWAEDPTPTATEMKVGGASAASEIKPANNPAQCGTISNVSNGVDKAAEEAMQDSGGTPSCSTATPPNCLFLTEPIGGETGYDLYKFKTIPGGCRFYELWNGEFIDNKTSFGPVQAVLTSQPGREYQGAFGLLYNYVGLIYKYMSGLIVGFAVLLIIIGGIQISMAGADAHAYETAKGRITKALMGVIIWFLASLILYTINPTFFTF